MSTHGKVAIATVGSIIMDLAVSTPRVPHTGENILAHAFRKGPGGKGANAAAAVARLGADSFLVGGVGDDEFGREELAFLRQLGVDTSGVSVRGDSSTGIAVILVDDNRENTILVVLGANAELTAEGVGRSLGRLWSRLDALMVNFEVPEPVVAGVIHAANEHGVPVVLDAGPPRQYLRDTWRRAQVVSPNRMETEHLVGHPVENEAQLLEAAREILDAGPQAVVIKRGREGSLICTREGTEAVPIIDIERVDTTGAGDAFTSALTVGIAEGMTLRQAVRFGTAAGAVAVSRFGTMPAMPTRDEVDALLAGATG